MTVLHAEATTSDQRGQPLTAATLAERYRDVRAATEALAAPLTPEDCAIQSMPEASPVKWHLAHTSWFFETFVLAGADRAYHPFDPRFAYLFNSYYDAVGNRLPRSQRGQLSRPTLSDVYRYRAYIDGQMLDLLESEGSSLPSAATVELGLHHEQQHQELVLTDIKHAFASNPLRPAYREKAKRTVTTAVSPPDWVIFPAGLHTQGHDGPGFAFDNETPSHQVWQPSFQLASRLITNGEYLEFMEAGGYERPEFWLSDGWAVCGEQRWRAPLYWEQQQQSWRLMTLAGMQTVNEAEPVCHVSFFEADAYARWAGARLATETEWEVAAARQTMAGNFLDSGHLQPVPASPSAAPLRQLFGDVWEWTTSAYSAYPGYRPLPGALGEYNGKFMCNQMVLRGGSCLTPAAHIRPTYRNFFPAKTRWQCAGIRLAKDHE
jgi:ergothioneine biosynthesis protein EgtB